MRKLLRPQDILLLGLANILDFAEEVRDPLEIAAKSYKSMYGFIPSRYKRHNFNHLVWRNLKTGYIEKVIKDGMPYLRLTSAGKKRIERDFPLLAVQKKKLDRKWRVVIFDIEEVSRKVRERFRYKLREIGFGMLQESVFISPYDIARDFAEFIESQGLSDSAYLFEVSNIVIGDIKSLANKVWNINQLNEEYKNIIQKIDEADLISISDRRKKLKTDKNSKNIPGKDKRNITSDLVNNIWREYLELVLRDPFLPKELLPLDWEGEKARFLIRNMRKIIDRE